MKKTMIRSVTTLCMAVVVAVTGFAAGSALTASAAEPAVAQAAKQAGVQAADVQAQAAGASVADWQSDAKLGLEFGGGDVMALDPDWIVDNFYFEKERANPLNLVEGAKTVFVEYTITNRFGTAIDVSIQSTFQNCPPDEHVIFTDTDEPIMIYDEHDNPKSYDIHLGAGETRTVSLSYAAGVDASDKMPGNGNAFQLKHSVNGVDVGMQQWLLTIPVPAVNKVLATFDSNGGSTVKPQVVSYGKSIGSLPTPTRTGYTFDGWYTARNGGARVGADYRVTGDVTLYAHWQIKTYSVRFDVNGGSAVADRTVRHGDTVGALPVPVRAGYTFAGWYTAESGGTKVNAGYKITAPVTYYARWTKLDNSASAAVVNAPSQKSVVKITAKASCSVKRSKAVKITLTGYKNVAVKSVKLDKKSKKLVKIVKGKNCLKIKALKKKGTAKITVTLKNGNKKTIKIRVK